MQCGRLEFDPWVWKILWTRGRLPTPVFWPAEFHGQRRLAGYNPWGHKESDKTERLSTQIDGYIAKLIGKWIGAFNDLKFRESNIWKLYSITGNIFSYYSRSINYSYDKTFSYIVD